MKHQTEVVNGVWKLQEREGGRANSYWEHGFQCSHSLPEIKRNTVKFLASAAYLKDFTREKSPLSFSQLYGRVQNYRNVSDGGNTRDYRSINFIPCKLPPHQVHISGEAWECKSILILQGISLFKYKRRLKHEIKVSKL